NQGPCAMIAFLIELWLAEYAHVDLRRDLIWVLHLMLAIPPPDRLDVLSKVSEELPPGHGDVPIEPIPIVPPTEQHKMVELQERFETLIAKQVETVSDNRVEKLVRGEHVLPHRVAKIITAAVEDPVDGREVA